MVGADDKGESDDGSNRMKDASRKIRKEDVAVTHVLEASFRQSGYFFFTTEQVNIDMLMNYVEEQ